MENESLIPSEKIERSILFIRGHRVMLDRDLADLYGIKSIRLREQVKRNKGRFPTDFMFSLTHKEVELLVSQNAIPSIKHLGGALPLVFTQEGIAMLSGVLRSKRAIQVNIAIMRAFIQMRRLLASQRGLMRKILEMEKKYDRQFIVVFDAIKQLMAPPEKPKKAPLGFRPH